MNPLLIILMIQIKCFSFFLLVYIVVILNNINQSHTVIELTWYYAMKSSALYVFYLFDLVPKYWVF